MLVKACPCGQVGGCGAAGHLDVAIGTGVGCVCVVVVAVVVCSVVGVDVGDCTLVGVVAVVVVVEGELPEVGDVVPDVEGVGVDELVGDVVEGAAVSVAIPVILEKIFFRKSSKVAAYAELVSRIVDTMKMANRFRDLI